MHTPVALVRAGQTAALALMPQLPGLGYDKFDHVSSEPAGVSPVRQDQCKNQAKSVRQDQCKNQAKSANFSISDDKTNRIDHLDEVEQQQKMLREQLQQQLHMNSNTIQGESEEEDMFAGLGSFDDLDDSEFDAGCQSTQALDDTGGKAGSHSVGQLCDSEVGGSRLKALDGVGSHLEYESWVTRGGLNDDGEEEDEAGEADGEEDVEKVKRYDAHKGRGWYKLVSISGGSSLHPQGQVMESVSDKDWLEACDLATSPPAPCHLPLLSSSPPNTRKGAVLLDRSLISSGTAWQFEAVVVLLGGR
jgi:hypothetical protein